MGDLDPGCVDDDPPTLRFCLKHIVLAIAAGCLGLLWDWLYSSVCSIQHNAWCCFDLSLSHWVLYSCCSMLFKALYIACQTHVELLVMSHSFATQIALWLWFVLIVVAIMLTVLGGCQLLSVGKLRFLVGSLIAVSAAVNFDCWCWSRLLKASLLSLLSLPCFFCFFVKVLVQLVVVVVVGIVAIAGILNWGKEQWLSSDMQLETFGGLSPMLWYASPDFSAFMRLGTLVFANTARARGSSNTGCA